jgi:hypothetical protein
MRPCQSISILPVTPQSRASSLPQGISGVAEFFVCKSIQRSEIKTIPSTPTITALAPKAIPACIEFNTSEMSQTPHKQLNLLI